MNKIIILLILLILPISLTSAVSVEPISIQGQIGQKITSSMNISNDLSLPIFNFQFSNLSGLGFQFPQINLSANESKIITFNVTPNQALIQTIQSKVSFNYLANIPEAITTYDLNISSNGFSTDFFVIRNGDTIRWTNIDSINHQVQSSLFSSGTISPSGNYAYTFNQLGTFEVIDPNWDEFSYFHQNIQIINRTSLEPVHNPSYDFNWQLNLNFLLTPTNLTLTPLGTNFTIDANGETDGLLNISNSGNEVAQSISITSDSSWILPKENNFNLNPNSQKFVAYTIFPIISDIQQTNKTYLINITVKGLNTGLQSTLISVFVPYNPNIGDIDTVEGFAGLINRLIELCRENPNHVLCNPNRTIIQPSGNGSAGNFSFNASQTDWGEYKRKVDSVESNVDTLTGDFRTLAESFGLTVPQLKDLINQSLQQALETEKKRKTASDVRWIIGFFIFIIILITSAVFIARKRSKKLRIVEGQYDYRRI